VTAVASRPDGSADRPAGDGPAAAGGSPGTSPRRRLRRALPALSLAGALVLLGVLAAPSGQGAPLDPNGTGPLGAKALVEVLRAYGAEVSLVDGVPGPGVQAAVVLSDRLDDDRRAGLQRWAAGGGLLLVADPSSPLQLGAPTRAGNGLTVEDLHPDGQCHDLGLGRLRLSAGPSLLLRAPGTAGLTRCFPYQLSGGEEADFLLASHPGSGTVVALGGAGLWTNGRLAADDNAALAVDLLAPRPGTRVAVLVPSRAGSGHGTAYGLLGPRVRSALLQLLVAFGVLAWWRGRRLGSPVPERQPVPVAGAEIVTAVGGLLARTRNRDAAARQLRDGARRWMGERLGLGRTAPPARVADAAAARLGRDPSGVLALLADRPVLDDAELVRLAQSLTQLRQEVTGGHLP